MKNISAFLVFFVVVSMSSCRDRSGASDAFVREHDDTALELYYKYAENKDLTVAYMGDFFLNGNKIDALMLRADLDEDWIRLKSEFGMMPENDNTKIISVGIELDTDFLVELGLDTITDISQVDEERLNKMNAIIADKLRDIVNKFPAPDANQSTNAYANTLAEAIGKTLLNEVLVKNGALPDEQINVPDGVDTFKWLLTNDI